MKRVLIVDDQADLRRLVRWSLEGLETPFELHEANGAVAGLQMALLLKPNVVLLDVMMPGPMDGLEVCRQIRAADGMDDTAVVLVSARGQAADVKAGMEAGAQRYVVKPFSPVQLTQVVEELLRLSKARPLARSAS